MKIFLAALVMALSLKANAGPLTFLEMSSESGDYVGQGLDYYFTESDGLFTAAQSYWGNPAHANRSVSLSFRAPDFSQSWYLDFSTRALGVDLQPGIYDAVRFPFEPNGLAGLSVVGNGRGSNTLTGTFTVLDVVFGLNGTIERFAATFEQHNAGLEPALIGKIAFNSEAFNVDTPPPAYLLAATGLAAFLRLRRRRAT